VYILSKLLCLYYKRSSRGYRPIITSPISGIGGVGHISSLMLDRLLPDSPYVIQPHLTTRDEHHDQKRLLGSPLIDRSGAIEGDLSHRTPHRHLLRLGKELPSAYKTGATFARSDGNPKRRSPIALLGIFIAAYGLDSTPCSWFVSNPFFTAPM